MPSASRTAMNSSTVTARFGAECRSAASGASRRMTCAWQSIAVTARASVAQESGNAMDSGGKLRVARSLRKDRGVAAATILRFELRRRNEAALEILDLR